MILLYSTNNLKRDMETSNYNISCCIILLETGIEEQGGKKKQKTVYKYNVYNYHYYY